jgi:hypothetical protein
MTAIRLLKINTKLHVLIRNAEPQNYSSLSQKKKKKNLDRTPKPFLYTPDSKLFVYDDLLLNYFFMIFAKVHTFLEKVALHMFGSQHNSSIQ